jgi:hypothetical protein
MPGTDSNAMRGVLTDGLFKSCLSLNGDER